MKLLNKSLAVILSVVMLFSLVGCSLDGSDYIDSSGEYQTESSSSLEDSSSKTEQLQTDQTESPSTITNSSQTETPTTTTKPTENPNNNTGVGTGTATAVNPATLPAYNGTAYTVVSGNQPNFSSSELTTKGYEKYSNLDSRGRCGAAIASCGKEIMPGANEERGNRR